MLSFEVLWVVVKEEVEGLGLILGILRLFREIKIFYGFFKGLWEFGELSC